MGMKETILADLKTAMKNQEAAKLSAIRFLQSAIKNREIELRPAAITDQDVMAVIKKICNQHKDSIEQFTSAGRLDLVDNEKVQLAVLEAYLPKQMPRADLEKVIAEIMTEMKASSMKDMGGVIKAVIAKTAGAADSKLISEIVKSKLS
ncbi:MAG: GatB/YqeY domain-containing protein [Bdellovibrionales bacterium]|nr:GatB/YqeY domain-containing protein [Bdellovibrionales bacterium]